MKKSENSSDKKVLIVLAVLVIAAIVVVVLGVGKGGEQPTNNDSNNSDVVEEEIVTGPSIAGSENVSQSGDVRTNVSSALKSDKTFDIYKFTEISLESVAGTSTLTASVTADLAEGGKVSGRPVVINFYDKAGNVVESMGAYIPQVKYGETKMLSAQSTTDLANAYDFAIVAAE